MSRLPARSRPKLRAREEELDSSSPAWLATQKFDQTTHQIVFQDYVEAVWSAQDRRDQLEARISAMLSDWSMVPLGETFKQEFGQDIRDLWDADDISLENFTQSIHRDVRSVRTSRGTPRPAQQVVRRA